MLLHLRYYLNVVVLLLTTLHYLGFDHQIRFVKAAINENTNNNDHMKHIISSQQQQLLRGPLLNVDKLDLISNEPINVDYGDFSINHSYYRDIIPKGTQLLTQDEISELNIEYPDLTAIIHIGPMKTGSTALQTTLKHMFNINNPKNDSDNYLPVRLHVKRYNTDDRSYGVGSMLGCFRDPRGHVLTYAICQPDILSKIQDLASIYHHNTIISAEYLTRADTNLTALKEFLSPWKKHRIVIYYRRYYDWINSLHNEIEKKKTTPRRISLTNYLYKESIHQMEWNDMYTMNAFNRWKEHFQDVYVVNMYEESYDNAEMFYCNVLINASQTCNKYHSKTELIHKVMKRNSNPSVAFIYEDLAYHAKELNLWSETEVTTTSSNNTINDVTHKIKYYQENVLNLTRYDFGIAKECPNQNVSDYLLKQSLDTEKLLFPLYYKEKGEEQIRNEFATQIQTKLCHINAVTVLTQNNNNGTIWNHFFKEILPTM